MEQVFREKLQKLERDLRDLESAAKSILGLSRTIVHEGILFDVGKQFVMADMSPLAFFYLVEEIDEEGAEEAVKRLYSRLQPLLTCRHTWTVLKRSSDWDVFTMAKECTDAGLQPRVCTACTAYALGSEDAGLPVVGRMLA